MPDSTAGPDLLTEPMFTVAGADGAAERLSLPALLARLLTGPEVAAFPHVTAEQRGHWWRFLVRCAAKALHELESSPAEAAARPQSELAAEISAMLRRLAGEGAWLLYQPEAAAPGFLQIPTPDGASPGKGNNYSARSVSLLTSTIGGKNHERKSDVARALGTEETVYALLEYQLSAIFGGRGNYETQLLGSRAGAGSGVPFMGARIADSNLRSFHHDVGVMLERWTDVVHMLGVAGKTWALWVEPWDGKGQLGSERLDPAFIPVGRMVRLGAPEVGVFSDVWFRPTDTGRVRDHSGGGVLGDPFTPFVPDPKTGNLKVRGTLRDGYTYREIVRLLFGDPKNGGQRSNSVDVLRTLDDQRRTDLTVLFEGTAYEQGKTGGFHRREVALPALGVSLLADPHPLREAHAAMLERVTAAKSTLRGAARILLSGELKPRQGDEGKSGAPATELEQRVDAAYLDHLFAAVERRESGDEQWLQPWLEWLARETEASFHATRDMIPTSTGRRLQRETEAENYLGFKLWQLRGSPRAEQGEGASVYVADDQTTTEPMEEEDS
jgi:hypothetical protein